jgi:NAD(P)-dependent dehydrogenase (short-subunit alcohol dehydrogenase family)
VTGAGGGIGGATSRLFAAEGAAVVCIDINNEALEKTVGGVKASGGKAIAYAADVAAEETAVKAVDMAKSSFGRLDILFCNAVYDLPLAPLTEISHKDWRRTMEVNLDSAFLFSKYAIPVMEAGGGGSIILVASQLARVARPGRPWYCAAKGALVNLAKAMALDHATQNIRVDTLEAARASHHTLTGRLGAPEEIATGAVFLASDESSFMTGADLLIDGGYTAV